VGVELRSRDRNHIVAIKMTLLSSISHASKK